MLLETYCKDTEPKMARPPTSQTCLSLYTVHIYGKRQAGGRKDPFSSFPYAFFFMAAISYNKSLSTRYAEFCARAGRKIVFLSLLFLEHACRDILIVGFLSDYRKCRSLLLMFCLWCKQPVSQGQTFFLKEGDWIRQNKRRENSIIALAGSEESGARNSRPTFYRLIM